MDIIGLAEVLGTRNSALTVATNQIHPLLVTNFSTMGHRTGPKGPGSARRTYRTKPESCKKGLDGGEDEDDCKSVRVVFIEICL